MAETTVKWPKTPTMTRQHFDYIARIISELDLPFEVAYMFACHLRPTNPNFSRERFIDACCARR